MPSAADGRVAGALKPAAERLYGRSRGKTLRTRQQCLLDVTLPRLLLTSAHAPMAAFDPACTSLSVEIGFGGGEHARAQVLADPQAALIACEVYQNGICSLLSALVPAGLEASAPLPGNLRIWPDDGRAVLASVPPGSLDRVFLLFPDPWPKARHAKRRFVHPDNIALIARALRPGGDWRVASDDPTYQAWCAAVWAEQTLFDVDAPVAVRPAGWPQTRYERKAERAGRGSLWWRAVRNGVGV